MVSRGHTWTDYDVNLDRVGALMCPNAWALSALVRALGERYLTVDTNNIPHFTLFTNHIDDSVFGEYIPYDNLGTSTFEKYASYFMGTIDRLIAELYKYYLNLHKYKTGLLPIGEKVPYSMSDVTWDSNSMYNYLYGYDIPKKYESDKDVLATITFDDIPEWSLDYYIYFVNTGFIKIKDLLDKIHTGEVSSVSVASVYDQIHKIISPDVKIGETALGLKYSYGGLMRPIHDNAWLIERVKIINSLTHYVIQYNQDVSPTSSYPIIPYKKFSYYWDDIKDEPDNFVISEPTNAGKNGTDSFSITLKSFSAYSYSTLWTLNGGRRCRSSFKPTVYYSLGWETGGPVLHPERDKLNPIPGRKAMFIRIQEGYSTEGIYKEFKPEHGNSCYGFFANNPTEDNKIKGMMPEGILTDKEIAESWQNQEMGARYMILNFMTEPNTESHYSSGFKFRLPFYGGFSEYNVFKEDSM